jgi:hypothetical protein
MNAKKAKKLRKHLRKLEINAEQAKYVSHRRNPSTAKLDTNSGRYQYKALKAAAKE